MQIVLIGGAGFIGGYLTDLLRKRDDCLVTVIDRDSNLEAAELDPRIAVLLTQPNQPPLDDLLTSIFSCSSWRNLNKILYLSTLLVYPDSKRKQDEGEVPAPLTWYEQQKYHEERLLGAFIKEKSCKLCIARLSNVYGDIKNKGIVNSIMLSLIQGGSFTVYGEPKRKVRDYIFIEDAVKLLEFLIFLNQEDKKEIFNVCTGRGYSVLELINIAETMSKKKIDFEVGDKVLEKSYNVGDNQKIIRTTHYKLRYDLREGLEKSFSNYLKKYSV